MMVYGILFLGQLVSGLLCKLKTKKTFKNVQSWIGYLVSVQNRAVVSRVSDNIALDGRVFIGGQRRVSQSV